MNNKESICECGHVRHKGKCYVAVFNADMELVECGCCGGEMTKEETLAWIDDLPHSEHYETFIDCIALKRIANELRPMKFCPKEKFPFTACDINCPVHGAKRR